MLTLRQKLERVLTKHGIDETVPALASELASAGVQSGVSKRVFVAYVVEVIDLRFEQYERSRRDSEK